MLFKEFMKKPEAIPHIFLQEIVVNFTVTQRFFFRQEMIMNEHHPQNIAEYLQQDEAQERIREHIQQARSKMAVTISRAARLLNFSGSQLRGWEKRGLLQTERPLLSPDGKGVTG